MSTDNAPNMLFIVADLVRSTCTSQQAILMSAALKFEDAPDTVMDLYQLTPQERCTIYSMNFDQIMALVTSEAKAWYDALPRTTLWPPAAIPIKGVTSATDDQGNQLPAAWSVAHTATTVVNVTATSFSKNATGFLQPVAGGNAVANGTSPLGQPLDLGNVQRSFALPFPWAQVPPGQYSIGLSDCSGSYLLPAVTVTVT